MLKCCGACWARVADCLQAAFVWLLQPRGHTVGIASARGRGALCPNAWTVRLHSSALFRSVANQPSGPTTQGWLSASWPALQKTPESFLQLLGEAPGLQSSCLSSSHVSSLFISLLLKSELIMAINITITNKLADSLLKCYWSSGQHI